MPVTVCPGCEKKLRMPDAAEGKRFRCPACGVPLVLTEDGAEYFVQEAKVTSSKRAAAEAAPALTRKQPARSREEDEETPDETEMEHTSPPEEEEETDRPQPKGKGKKRKKPKREKVNGGSAAGARATGAILGQHGGAQLLAYLLLFWIIKKF